MKPAAMAVAGLSLAFGMAVVYAFREPAKKKKTDDVASTVRRDDEDRQTSRRTAVGGAPAPASAVPARTSEAPARGVDPLWAQKNRTAIQLLEKGENAEAVALF